MSQSHGTDKKSMYILSPLSLHEAHTLLDFHLLQNVRPHRSIYPYSHHFSSLYGEALDIAHLFLYNIKY